MIIQTASGPVKTSKRSRYAAWLTGYKSGGAWTGAASLRAAWDLSWREVGSARTLKDAERMGRIQALAFQAGYTRNMEGPK